jgi:RimJ/RimL family protein N-acetyltransferase
LIRLATLADKNQAIKLLKDSREGAGFDQAGGFTFPFDPAYAERFFLRHLNNEFSTAIVHDVDGVAQGLLTGIVYEHEYGPVRVAKETMWWIDPAHRGGTAAIKMLDSFERWARAKFAKYVGVAGMGEQPNVGVLYERRGYRPAELHYIKEI